jgi:Phage portal protein, SPP1 Gp6-like
MQTLSITQQAQALSQAPTPQVDRDRKLVMKDAWKAYRGEFMPPLKVSANQPDDNCISNRCMPIVDKGVSFLFGQVLAIEPNDETSKPDTRVLAFLKGLWGDDDERMTLLSQMAINGGVCGQVFLKLIPAQGEMKYPRIVVMDPLLVRVVTDPDDCSLILAYVIEYPSQNDIEKRQIVARIDPDNMAGIAGQADLDDTWTITNYQRKTQSVSWQQVGPVEYWEYPFAPIFMCQNLPNPNEVWGIPDLTPDLIGLNKELNFIQSNTARIIKFHGHPKTYATGLSATQINIGVDDLLCLPSPDSKLANLEMKSNLTDQITFAMNIRGDMDEQSRVPAIALGRETSLPRGNISGVALQLLFQPLIEKTTQKQRLYGCLIRYISRAALVLAGMLSLEEYEDYPISLHWQSLLPNDDLMAAQTALLLQQLGVSQYTMLSELGYDPDAEMEKVRQEQADKMANAARGQMVMAGPPQIPGMQRELPGQPTQGNQQQQQGQQQ